MVEAAAQELLAKHATSNSREWFQVDVEAAIAAVNQAAASVERGYIPWRHRPAAEKKTIHRQRVTTRARVQRKRLSEGRSSALVIKVWPSLKEVLDQVAAEDGRSTSQFTERLLIAHLQEKGRWPK